MPSGYLRVTMHATFRNQQSVNVLHYKWSHPGVALTPMQIMLGWSGNPEVDDLIAAYKACLSQQANYIGMKVRYLHPGGSYLDQQIHNTEELGPGLAEITGILPSQICGLISKRTAVQSRRGRGRFYMPFVPDSADTPNDDLVAAAYLTLLTDLGAWLTNTMSTAIDGQAVEYLPGLISNPYTGEFFQLTECVARGGFATQRRRGFYGRPNTLTL